MDKVKPFLCVEIGASKKSADIRKYTKKCFCQVPKTNKILGKVTKLQVNTISLSKAMTFFI